MTQIRAEMTFSSPRIDQVIMGKNFFGKGLLYNQFLA